VHISCAWVSVNLGYFSFQISTVIWWLRESGIWNSWHSLVYYSSGKPLYQCSCDLSNAKRPFISLHSVDKYVGIFLFFVKVSDKTDHPLVWWRSQPFCIHITNWWMSIECVDKKLLPYRMAELVMECGENNFSIFFLENGFFFLFNNTTTYMTMGLH